MAVILKAGKNQIKAIHCRNLFTISLGLMFRKKAAALLALPLSSKALAGIHTLFMRFAIDVYWLDKSLKVVDIRKGIKPWRIHIAPKCMAKYILELPSGGLELKTGDKIRFA